MLQSIDTEYLKRFPGHAISVDGPMICILIPNFPLAPGLDRQSADLLLRLAAGYPDIPPDMWWFTPSVCRADGVVIPATQVVETYLGRQWQRWSRHLAQGQWKSGLDSIESYLSLVRKELVTAAVVKAA